LILQKEHGPGALMVHPAIDGPPIDRPPIDNTSGHRLYRGSFLGLWGLSL